MSEDSHNFTIFVQYYYQKHKILEMCKDENIHLGFIFINNKNNLELNKISLPVKIIIMIMLLF